jgi:GNAT superfamily N-acetyltransferase
MTTQIRNATAADMPAIMDLLRAKAEFDGWADGFIASADDLRDAWFGQSPPKGFVLLAEIEGLVVGIAAYFETFSTFLARPGLWLDDLYVQDAYRSRGVGAALMSALARLALARGCGRIEWTVALRNDRGIAFYERQGSVVRQQTRFVRLDAAGIERLTGGPGS